MMMTMMKTKTTHQKKDQQQAGERRNNFYQITGVVQGFDVPNSVGTSCIVVTLTSSCLLLTAPPPLPLNHQSCSPLLPA